MDCDWLAGSPSSASQWYVKSVVSVSSSRLSPASRIIYCNNIFIGQVLERVTRQNWYSLIPNSQSLIPIQSDLSQFVCLVSFEESFNKHFYIPANWWRISRKIRKFQGIKSASWWGWEYFWVICCCLADRWLRSVFGCWINIHLLSPGYDKCEFILYCFFSERFFLADELLNPQNCY